MMQKRGLMAIALAVIAVGLWQGAAIAGPKLVIPPHSIGWNKLTAGVRTRITKHAAVGETGPQGEAGIQGVPGPQGPRGEGGEPSVPSVFPYSAALVPGDTEEVANIGPLTFTAFCEAEGEDVIRGKLEVTSNENGVVLNGLALNQGSSRKLQEKTVAGSGREEDFFPVLRATNGDGSFALQGVPSILVELPEGGCHFWGSLIEDS